jgi:hypothetical protein
LAKPLKEYLPELSAIVLALAAPLSATVAPPPPEVGVIVPEMPNVCAVAAKFIPVTLAPLIVAARLLGLKV